jgi:hypothetical protein
MTLTEFFMSCAAAATKVEMFKTGLSREWAMTGVSAGIGAGRVFLDKVSAHFHVEQALR